MRNLYPVLLSVVAMVCGCSGERGGNAPAHSDEGEAQPAQSIDIIVESEEEHLGHDTSEENIHVVWIDGMRGRILDTGEPFVVYWLNNQIAQTSFSFKEGKTYSLIFWGELQDGVMAYEGKCIDITQLQKVEEKTE